MRSRSATGQYVRMGESVSITITERFWSKVVKGPKCWLWTAKITTNGYGSFSIGAKDKVSAHRWLYERINGPLPEGMELDHLCRTTACVNPAHMEPVTHRENMRRGTWATRAHCPQGHPYDEANTYVYPNGWRKCRTCKRARDRRIYHRRKALAPAKEKP